MAGICVLVTARPDPSRGERAEPGGVCWGGPRSPWLCERVAGICVRITVAGGKDMRSRHIKESLLLSLLFAVPVSQPNILTHQVNGSPRRTWTIVGGAAAMETTGKPTPSQLRVSWLPSCLEFKTQRRKPTILAVFGSKTGKIAREAHRRQWLELLRWCYIRGCNLLPLYLRAVA